MTKTVVVTGAGSGIGRAIAMTLAGRDWRVVVTDINEDAAREVTAGLPNPDAGHESAVLDVSVPDDAAAVAFGVADRLGLDAWVSNAGISFMHRFLDAPIEVLWERVNHRNETGPPGTPFISRESLETWAEMFEPPDADEMSLFDPPNPP